jgi:hypothetical protein
MNVPQHPANVPYRRVLYGRDLQMSVFWFLEKFERVDGYVSGCCAPVGISGVRSGWLGEETFA